MSSLGLDKSQWARWYKKNIQGNDFAIEGIDYQTFDIMSNGNETKDFALTLDFAKNIAMMTRTERGEQAREYFIECEKQLKSKMLPQTYAEALRELADSWEREQELLKENKQMKPKAEYFDNLVERNLLTNFRDTAKELYIKEKTFIKALSESGFIYRDIKNRLKPYAEHVDNGLFELKEYTTEKMSGVQTLITPKGRETFRLLFSNINVSL